MSNWLDNLVAFVSPKRGAERAAWRNAYREIRSYDAGDGRRLNAGWRAFNQSAEMTDRPERDVIRARARDLERNSDITEAILWAYKRNVIGKGFALQARTGSDRKNKELEKLWKKWTKARNCDVTGQQSLNQMLRMAVVRKKVDGGVFFVKCYTSDGMVPFQLQMLEVDELDSMMDGRNTNGHTVVGGIAYNAYNRPVGYYFRQYSPDGMTLQKPRYVKADDVIFYYTKRRPSQIREVSDLAPTMSRIRDANEFMTAVSVKERINACLSVFIKKQIPATGIGRGGDRFGETRHEYDGKTLTPGMIKELNAGDEVQVVNPTGQSADATSFIKLQQRMIGAGQGLSYEATSRDMSETNYSSARQGAIEDEMAYQEEVEAILAILDEVYETFVISCVLSGRIEFPAGFWGASKDKYLAHEWIRTPKKWIDPLKESNAAKTALNTGQKTYKELAAENGRDWRGQIDDTVEVLDYAKSKGYDFANVFFDGRLKANQAAGEGSGGGDQEEPATEQGGESNEQTDNATA